MHSFNPPMPIPVYEIPPYTYSGLIFDELPPVAQKFLSESNLDPHNLDQFEQGKVNALFSLRAQRFYRTLEGVHMALVSRRREVVLLKRDPVGNESAMDAKNLRLNEIECEVGNILLPEWRSHFDNFMIDFDALIWLEIKAREDTPYAATISFQHQYRNKHILPLIESAINSLPLLHDLSTSPQSRRAEETGWGRRNGSMRFTRMKRRPSRPSLSASIERITV